MVQKKLEIPKRVLVKATVETVDTNAYSRKSTSKVDKSITLHYVLELNDNAQSTSQTSTGQAASQTSTGQAASQTSSTGSIITNDIKKEMNVTLTEFEKNLDKGSFSQSLSDLDSVVKSNIKKLQSFKKVVQSTNLSDGEKSQIINETENLISNLSTVATPSITSVDNKQKIEDLIETIADSLEKSIILKNPTLKVTQTNSKITIAPSEIKKVLEGQVIKKLADLLPTNLKFDKIYISFFEPMLNSQPILENYTKVEDIETLEYDNLKPIKDDYNAKLTTFGTSNEKSYFKRGEGKFKVELHNLESKTFSIPFLAVDDSLNSYNGVEGLEFMYIKDSSFNKTLNDKIKLALSSISVNPVGAPVLTCNLIPVFLNNKKIVTVSSIQFDRLTVSDKPESDDEDLIYFTSIDFLAPPKNKKLASPKVNPSQTNTPPAGGPP